MKRIRQLLFVVTLLVAMVAGSVVSYAQESVPVKEGTETVTVLEEQDAEQATAAAEEAVSEEAEETEQTDVQAAEVPEVPEEQAEEIAAEDTDEAVLPEDADEAVLPEETEEVADEAESVETEEVAEETAPEETLDIEESVAAEEAVDVTEDVSEETAPAEELKDPEEAEIAYKAGNDKAKAEKKSAKADKKISVQLQEDPVLAVPQLKSCTVNRKSVTVTWNAVQNAESYAIYLYDTNSSAFKKIGTSKTTSYEYTKVASGTSYNFSVAAVSGTTTGNYDTKGISVIYLAPVKTTSKISGKSAVLSWGKITGAKGYNVYRRTQGSKSWKLLKALSSGKVSYTDSTVKSGKNYEYVVRAYSKSGSTTWNSFYDDTDIVSFCLIGTPVLSKVAIKLTGFKFSWKKVKNAKQYQVYRRTKTGKWKKLKTTKRAYYIDRTGIPGKRYFYTVAAISSQGTVGNYDQKGLSGMYLRPAVQPTLKNQDDGIAVNWSKVTGVSGYRIMRRPVSTKKWTTIAEVKGLSYVDSTAESGTTYQYMAVPYKMLNDKKELAGYTKKSISKLLRLATPKLTETTSDDGGIRLTWKDVEGAKKFNIYRSTKQNGSWNLIGTTEKTSYVDENVSTGKSYYYTVAAQNGKTMSDYGDNSLEGLYLPAVKYQKSVSTMNGLKLDWKAVSKAYAYRVYKKSASGELTLLGKTKKTYFLDKDVKDKTTYRYVVRAYSDKCPKCEGEKKTKKSTYADPIRKQIRKTLDKCGWDLKAAFEWARSVPFIDAQPEAKNTRDYTKWLLDNGKGDCYGKAAVFVMMAQEIGYESYMVKGFVPFANGGGSNHGWAEVIIDKEVFVCDIAYNNGGADSAYLVKYGQKGTLKYKDYYRIP